MRAGQGLMSQRREACVLGSERLEETNPAGSPLELIASRSTVRTSLSKALTLAVEHPATAIGTAAAAIRSGCIAVLLLSSRNVTFSDERQYIELSAAVSAGRSAESYQPGYGQSLYNETRPFSATLARLFDIFGPSRWTGQLLATSCAVGVAVLTVCIARSLGLSSKAVLLSGAIVAFLPSQVIWSSTVLRESMVWLGITLVAYGIIELPGAKRSRVLIPALCSGSGLLLVCGLRPLTGVVTIWAFALAVVVTWRHRLRLILAGLAFASLAPLASGLGVAGSGFVARNMTETTATRERLAVAADTALVSTPPLAMTPATPPAAVVLVASHARAESVESSDDSSFGDGVLAVALRPLPGEHATSASNLLAQFEAPVWIALYAAAPFGVLLLWRRKDVGWVFPVMIVVGVLTSNALSQGNLGTAFRHRAQILWALAVLAGGAYDWRHTWSEAKRSKLSN